MSLQRVARGAVLLAAVAALVGILTPTSLESGWLSRLMAVAWALLALLTLITVRRRFLAGEVLIAVLALGPGCAFILDALGDSGPLMLDAAQALLMATALVLFAISKGTARSRSGAEVSAQSRRISQAGF